MEETILDLLDEAIKHGKHNQASHGRRTARRRAYSAAYSQARAGGATPQEARAKAKEAGLARQSERDARLERLRALNTPEARAQREAEQIRKREREIAKRDIEATTTRLRFRSPDFMAPATEKQKAYASSLVNTALMNTRRTSLQWDVGKELLERIPSATKWEASAIITEMKQPQPLSFLILQAEDAAKTRRALLGTGKGRTPTNGEALFMLPKFTQRLRESLLDGTPLFGNLSNDDLTIDYDWSDD